LWFFSRLVAQDPDKSGENIDILRRPLFAPDWADMPGPDIKIKNATEKNATKRIWRNLNERE